MHTHDPSLVPVENNPKYDQWGGVVPLPSELLMGTVGATDIENFFVVGDAWAQVATRLLGPERSMLDIGCGCGRTARFLLNVRDLHYVGFDIFKPSIDWCATRITPATSGRFRFFHFDGGSAHYNPDGEQAAERYRFPAADDSTALVIAASLFTHLKEPDAVHYLAETARVLQPGGKALFSIHGAPEAGSSYSGDEDRIDIRPDYFIEIAARAGLSLKERVGDLCGQEALVFGG